MPRQRQLDPQRIEHLQRHDLDHHGHALAGDNGWSGLQGVFGNSLTPITIGDQNSGGNPAALVAGGPLSLGYAVEIDRPVTINASAVRHLGRHHPRRCDLAHGSVSTPAGLGAGFTGAITVNSSNVNLSAAPGGSVFFSGGIGGTGGITAASRGNGNVSLSNANTYTGSTTVSSGQLTLDYTNVTSGIVSASSNVILSGGTLAVNDSQAGPVNETFAATTISNFGSAFVVNLNSYQGVQINFNTITRTGGVLDLPVSGTGNLFTTANGNTNGILGGYMTVNGYTDWAANDVPGTSSLSRASRATTSPTTTSCLPTTST